MRNLPRATQLLSNRSMVHRWAVWSRSPWLFAPTLCHPIILRELDIRRLQGLSVAVAQLLCL